jgi:glutamate synthase (NADPH/NADH) small chain
MPAAKKRKSEKIPRQPMPEQDPAVRRRNFDEVPLGLDEKTAVTEARRCLQCKKPACVEGCPVGVDIPGFVDAIAGRRYAEAIRRIWKTNALPAVCGRVCPQEIQCEQRCILAKKGDPVAIGNLERFAADTERRQGSGELPEKAPPTGKRVAVVWIRPLRPHRCR